MAPTSVKPNRALRSAGAPRSLRLLSLALVAVCAYGADECASVAEACVKDANCKACLITDAAPIACATTATTCEDWWDMACCTYGNSDACLENDLLLSHLQCLAEGNDCTIDAVCPEFSTDRVVQVDVGDGDGTGCIPEITECIYDSECSGCLNAAVPDNCAPKTATSVCGAVSEMMCCLYGDNAVCHSNKLLTAYTGCVAAASACTIDDLCSEGQDGAEAVGTENGSEDGDTGLAGRSSGNIVTCAAALAFVLPVIVLSGVATFL